MKSITSSISYLPASMSPLSADIGIVYGEQCVYLYDVGSNEESLRLIQGSTKPKVIVLSHFHQDHIGNWNKIDEANYYVGSHTKRYVPDGNVVAEKVTIQDGIQIEIMPLPSTHAKGSLIMTIDQMYTFLGDATYPMERKGIPLYNAQLLKAEIEVLKSLSSKYVLLSHDKQYVYERQEIIEQLEKQYDKRKKNEAYIEV